MKLNCRPGDMAVIVRPTLRGPQLLGMVVTIMHAAPIRDFLLPDGFKQLNDRPNYWVVEFQRQIEAPMLFGGFVGARLTRYGIAPDVALRPIRDNPGADETLEWAPVPAKREGVPA